MDIVTTEDAAYALNITEIELLRAVLARRIPRPLQHFGWDAATFAAIERAMSAQKGN